MKYLLIFAITACSFTMQAQPPQGDRHAKREMRKERPNFTPEQIAELNTNKLTLGLELNESQANRVKALELDLATKRAAKRESMKDRKDLSDEALFELKNESLKNQIAHKNSMKSILTADQFEKWEKARHRKGAMIKRHRMKKRS